jgi:hypothetical protein
MVTIDRPCFPHQLRLKRKHQTCLGLSGMQSALELFLWNPGIQAGHTTPDEAGKNRHRW